MTRKPFVALGVGLCGPWTQFKTAKTADRGGGYLCFSLHEILNNKLISYIENFNYQTSVFLLLAVLFLLLAFI